jgi:N-acetyl-anhydromuramyl-L-alanine amidase AmpD
MFLVCASDSSSTPPGERNVSVKRKNSKRISTPSRRTQIVWVTFLTALTVVTGLLAFQDSDRHSGILLTSIDTVGSQSEAGDSIFQIAKPLDQKRWTGIVIHHLGEPAGDAESVTRKHLSMGYSGLGYHFLIGNGNGLADGVVHVGYRWNEQLPGAHVIGAQGDHHNQHSISICLIGNGDRRSFTDRQFVQLVSLVQRLQTELGIPARNVRLHRDLSSQTGSPGRFFAAARFQEQLLE